MLRIRFVVLARDLAPLRPVNFWKENITFNFRAHAGEVDAMSKGERLLVDFAATNDEDFVLGLGWDEGSDKIEGFFKGAHDVTTTDF